MTEFMGNAHKFHKCIELCMSNASIESKILLQEAQFVVWAAARVCNIHINIV